MSAADDTVLVIDIGTSSVRSARFSRDGTLSGQVDVATPPSTPTDGVCTFDPSILRDAAVESASKVLSSGGPVAGVGLAVQRASTVVWSRRTGEPLGPGIGWQDVRTVGRCLELRADGIHLAPNQTATKAEWLLDQLSSEDRAEALVGTLDSWLVWSLTRGADHLTDATNAAVTGLLGDSGWNEGILDTLDIPLAALPHVVDTITTTSRAVALPGAPRVLALVGDQQASMIGQGCLVPGRAKITFGSGAMLDMVVPKEVTVRALTDAGCFPIVAWQESGVAVGGVEAIMLGAGNHVAWLVDGLGLIDDVADSEAVAEQVDGTDGVLFVPALNGLGTPRWDHGARGTLLGLTRGTTRAHVVRAVLEGIANSAADLVDAAERATGTTIEEIRVDGGMSTNDTFVSLVADASQRPVIRSREREATARGAGLLAGVGAGWFPSVGQTPPDDGSGETFTPGSPTDRDAWRQGVERALGWIPELSALEF